MIRTSFDFVADQTQDLTTCHGLLQGLRDVMRLGAKGLLWGGVPCSSFLGMQYVMYIYMSTHTTYIVIMMRFVFMACSRTGRYVNIMGNEQFDEVRVGNILSSRFALLALICMCFNRHWVATCLALCMLLKHPIPLASIWVV